MPELTELNKCSLYFPNMRRNIALEKPRTNQALGRAGVAVG
jgi:hypothetical protein